MRRITEQNHGEKGAVEVQALRYHCGSENVHTVEVLEHISTYAIMTASRFLSS